ncbi:MAG TPA: VOC family protein [Rhizobiales bacterium]|nr:VOC family protein [Hyphomicrobiales bacterium]
MIHDNTSWLELNTYQPEDAMAFYSETLGWEFEPTDLPEGGAYWVARHNNKTIGGVFDLSETVPDDENDTIGQTIEAHWMTYMQVTDINKVQDIAGKSGGEVIRPALFLDGVGKLAVITDSAGALIGLIEPLKNS